MAAVLEQGIIEYTNGIPQRFFIVTEDGGEKAVVEVTKTTFDSLRAHIQHIIPVYLFP